jgi:hypothetical protein
VTTFPNKPNSPIEGEDRLQALLQERSPPSTSSAVGISLINSDQSLPMLQTNTEEEIADEAFLDSKAQKILPHLLSKF